VLGQQVWLTTAVERAAGPEDLRRALDRLEFTVPSPAVASHVTLRAICLDRRTGRVLHDVRLFDVDQPIVLCSTNSYASPTPCIEAGRLYADFGAMGTACVDTSTGKILWSRHLVVEHQVGPGSSPIIHGDHLILVRDGCYEQYVTALDKATGHAVWRTDRPPMNTRVAVHRKAFSTPLVFLHQGREQMVVPGAQWMVAYDPADGEELWRVDTGSTFSNASRPVYGQGLVFAGTAYGGSKLLAIRPGGGGDVTQTHVAWELRRGVPKRSSPLLVGRELYLVADNGIASCLDAASGQVHWTERLGGGYSASPVLAGGRIYFFAEDGTTTVIRPGTTFQLLAENRLDGRIMASPAFAGDAVFLRTDTHLWRLED
jgi:hypothetical protein